ncbi:hypothetical protein LRAMOSA10089 [Lichtheimia ramosa]|uniref:HCP-like protein n=1 Tax=Lichtheimia ramosa TaxID=688394 RepID=A0A077WNP0_9FUNG|nr:hypothetical protein LRAMOSA10089 [Lichtheimia ramosa]
MIHSTGTDVANPILLNTPPPTPLKEPLLFSPPHTTTASKQSPEKQPEKKPQQPQYIEVIAPDTPPPSDSKQKEKSPLSFDSLSQSSNASLPLPSPQSATTPSPRSSATPSHTLDGGSTRSSSMVSVSVLGEQQLLDHSHLKPGHRASLLSYAQTINMYRENAKKTNSPDIQCDFAIFMVEAAKPLATEGATATERWAYLTEAEKLLRQLSARGHAESQYYLGNLYAAGMLSRKGKNEFDKAFPLFVQATKHHHADASFRAAKCYEDGLGTRKDRSKAVQFYRKAATLSHPGAMYRLGVAQVYGELSISKNARDGVKWLKRAAEAATPEYPHAIHELAQLHETGIKNVVFVDLDYAVSLYAQAADLGYAPSAYRLGECYEYGRLNCDQDPALSIHYYTIAAQQGHCEGCFALTAWYLVGSADVLPQSDEQAYIWAHRAAEMGLAKAEYAVGYFTEVGIGTISDPDEAFVWYTRAAEHGDKRAIQRIQAQQGNTDHNGPHTKGKKSKRQDSCMIM